MKLIKPDRNLSKTLKIAFVDIPTVPEEPQRMSTYTLYSKKVRVIGLHFCCFIVWVYLHSNLWWAPWNASSLQECVSAVQGHPRSLILVGIESAYMRLPISPS